MHLKQGCMEHNAQVHRHKYKIVSVGTGEWGGGGGGTAFVLKSEDFQLTDFSKSGS